VHVVSNKFQGNVLIGTIGYQNLRNHSVGSVLQPRIEALEWPDRVTVDEMNWGPIAITQKFQTMDEPYDRVVMVCALERPQREIGDITCYRWQGKLPSEKQIQACVGDAVTGVTSVENLLIIGEYFKIWPDEVFILDVEPGPEKSGPHLTPEVETVIPEIMDAIKILSLEKDPEIATFNYEFMDVLIPDDGK
jgi:hypothetical protein